MRRSGPVPKAPTLLTNSTVTELLSEIWMKSVSGGLSGGPVINDCAVAVSLAKLPASQQWPYVPDTTASSSPNGSVSKQAAAANTLPALTSESAYMANPEGIVTDTEMIKSTTFATTLSTYNRAGTRRAND